ncbi:MAG: phage holin family protein [Actinomycetota bacterium]|nr:phage holin family protein [Actinomycetota bacterium]MDQ3575434.1 phage holin family protein [Actinomycetota bacterium]
MAQRHAGAAPDERPLKDLLSEMTAEISFLVSKEVELAKLEMQQKASLAAKGGGAMAVGGVAALLGLLLLSLAAAWGLAELLPTGFAFLVVAAVYLVVAAVMLSSGKKRFAQMKPPVPQQALTTVKQDVQVAKTSFSRGAAGSLAGRPSRSRSGRT